VKPEQMLDFILINALHNSETSTLKVLEFVCTVLILDIVLLWVFYHQKTVREKKEVEKLHQEVCEDDIEAGFYCLRESPARTLKKSQACWNLPTLVQKVPALPG
jgi:hypothetical protein